MNTTCNFKEKKEKDGFYPYNVLFGKTKDKAKITKLWILSFYTQNNIYDYVWNRKSVKFMRLIIIWDLKTRLRNMPQF